ncbi:MAG: T9SS type A sorting domain-containing protein [Bacteroidia bacterium]|nr:T9SS type A sorting domain-containing protein [Bacteroidia bacterium]
MDGRLLLEQNIKSAISNIDISELTIGVYMLKVAVKDGVVVRKLVKK